MCARERESVCVCVRERERERERESEREREEGVRVRRANNVYSLEKTKENFEGFIIFLIFSLHFFQAKVFIDFRSDQMIHRCDHKYELVKIF